jgi:hypothetical protein
MEEYPVIFEKKGFPSIRIFDEHFEIKAIDFWEYRTFKYSETKDITHYNPNEKWWNKFYLMTSPLAQLLSQDDPWILKIIKTNGGDWTYKTSYKSDSDFIKTINLLKAKIVD